MKFLGVPLRPRQLQYVAGDFLCALVAIQLGHWLRFGVGASETDVLTVVDVNTTASVFFLGSTFLCLYLADAYNTAFDFRQVAPHIRLWSAIVAALAIQLLAYVAFPHGWWGRGVAALVSLSFAFLVMAWRASSSRFAPPRLVRVNTLVVGAGQAAQLIAGVVRSQHEFDRVYNIVGFLDHRRAGNRRRTDYPDDEAVERAEGPMVLGAAADLIGLVERHRVELLIVALRGELSDELTQNLLACKARGVRIERMPVLYKRLVGKVPVLHLPDTWVIFSPVFSESRPFSASLERLVDIVIGLVGLIVSAPVIALAGIVVRLESPGPALFVQERLGLNERPFQIYKLRTMRQDAEAGTGAVWSQGAADPRVTRVGRFLRRSRIDELPQFYNVLRGDMAVVGPRPERQHFVDQLKQRIPFYAMRFSVKPGLTGWAQVMYRYGATEEDAAEKLSYELYAIQDLTPVLYVLILLKTVRTVLLRPGS